MFFVVFFPVFYYFWFMATVTLQMQLTPMLVHMCKRKCTQCGPSCRYGNRVLFSLQKSLQAGLPPSQKTCLMWAQLQPLLSLCWNQYHISLSPWSTFFWACGTKQMLKGISACGSCCCYEPKTCLHCCALKTRLLCCSLTALRAENMLGLQHCQKKKCQSMCGKTKSKTALREEFPGRHTTSINAAWWLFHCAFYAFISSIYKEDGDWIDTTHRLSICRLLWHLNNVLVLDETRS